MDLKRDLLRHALATIAYRGGKAVRDAPATFATFSPGGGTRTPVDVVAHMADLFDWALGLTKGNAEWRSSTAVTWDVEIARMSTSLGALDAYLASGEPVHCVPEQLLQGPVADALTHVGQLMMLRRLAGAPVKSENYFKAAVATGLVSVN